MLSEIAQFVALSNKPFNLHRVIIREGVYLSFDHVLEIGYASVDKDHVVLLYQGCRREANNTALFSEFQIPTLESRITLSDPLPPTNDEG